MMQIFQWWHLLSSRYQQNVSPYGREMTTFVACSGDIVQINNSGCSVRAAGAAAHTESLCQKMAQLILFQKGRSHINILNKFMTT